MSELREHGSGARALAAQPDRTRSTDSPAGSEPEEAAPSSSPRPRFATGRGAEGLWMFLIDSGMSVATTWILDTFLSMWAASQIFPSGPFLASTYWE